MQFSEFLKRDNIKLTRNYYDLCLDGIERMNGAVDINHDDNHVYQLLSELNQFLHNEKTVSEANIDFEILLPAICWHDVWKSKRKQTYGIPTAIFEQLYEGIGSFLIFKSHVKQKGYNLEKANEIAKAILLHPGYEFFPPARVLRNKLTRSSEILILADLDGLESSTSMQRVDMLLERHMKKKKTDPVLFRVGYFWAIKMILPKKNNSFNFPYTRKVFEDKKKVIQKKLIMLFNDLMENKDYWFDPEGPNYRYVKDFEPSSKDMELINGLS